MNLFLKQKWCSKQVCYKQYHWPQQFGDRKGQLTTRKQWMLANRFYILFCGDYMPINWP